METVKINSSNARKSKKVSNIFLINFPILFSLKFFFSCEKWTQKWTSPIFICAIILYHTCNYLNVMKSSKNRFFKCAKVQESFEIYFQQFFQFDSGLPFSQRDNAGMDESNMRVSKITNVLSVFK